MWIVLVAVTAALPGLAFAKRLAKRLAGRLAGKLFARAAARYRLEVTGPQVRFPRWDTVELSGFSVGTADFRRKAEVGRLLVQLDCLGVLTGSIRLKRLCLADVQVSVHAGKGAALKGNAHPPAAPSAEGPREGQPAAPARLLAKMLRQADRLSKGAGLLGTGQVEVSNLAVRLKFKNYLIRGEVVALRVGSGRIGGKMTLNDNGVCAQWDVSGTLNPRQHRFSVQLQAAPGEAVFIPGLNRKYHAEAAAGALTLTVEKPRGGHCAVRVEATGLRVSHPRLGCRPVALRQAAGQWCLRRSAGTIALATGSYLEVNGIRLDLELKYKFHPARELLVQLRMDPTPAEAVLQALPPGVFPLLEGWRVKGVLRLGGLYFLNFNRPADFVFESWLDAGRVELVQTGAIDFGALMQPFVHQVHENGQPVRIPLDPADPQFTPLAQLPPYLVETIICTEDREFRSHRGFDEYLYGYALTTNLLEGRFARGGSTLTMQVVKNVFLHHDKTLLRKLEEVFVVWAIEQFGLVSKERLLEIYFNIAEWGPQVYGIREAARFYFDKHPAELTLPESLYLSFALPRPKSFRKRLSADPALREQLVRHMQYFAKSLLDRRLITPHQYNTMRYDFAAAQPADVS